jgi:hypothetical protein
LQEVLEKSQNRLFEGFKMHSCIKKAGDPDRKRITRISSQSPTMDRLNHLPYSDRHPLNPKALFPLAFVFNVDQGASFAWPFIRLPQQSSQLPCNDRYGSTILSAILELQE